jgi:hypothetical protein
VDGEVDDRGGHGVLPPQEIRNLRSSVLPSRFLLLLLLGVCARYFFVWGWFPSLIYGGACAQHFTSENIIS